MTFSCVIVGAKETTQKIQSWTLTLTKRYLSFASIKVLYKWWNMLFISCLYSFPSWDDYIFVLIFWICRTLSLISQYMTSQTGCPISRSSRPEGFSRKGALKICIKFTGEPPWPSMISINLQSSFIEIRLRHGFSPITLLHIFRTRFPRNTSGWLLLK